MKNDMHITGIMINGEDTAIRILSNDTLIQYLEDLPDWDYDEVGSIFEVLCERLGLDLDDYECCDDVMYAIEEAVEASNGEEENDDL